MNCVIISLRIKAFIASDNNSKKRQGNAKGKREKKRKAREATVTKSVAYFLGPLPGKNQASDIFMKLIQKARQQEG